jgi:hypothetical protein
MLGTLAVIMVVVAMGGMTESQLGILALCLSFMMYSIPFLVLVSFGCDFVYFEWMNIF